MEKIMSILDAALKSLAEQSPVLGSISRNLALVESVEIFSLATDCVSQFYNPEFVEQRSEDVVFALANNAMHVAHNHIEIQKGKEDPAMFNAAADFFVNAILVRDGFKLPKDCLYDTRFEGMTVDEIYDILVAEDQAEIDTGTRIRLENLLQRIDSENV
jgi:predicted metal-dependent peptidase